MCRFASASILHGDLIKYLFRKLLMKIAGTPDPSSAGRLASAPLRWQELFLYTKLPRYQDEKSIASKVICSRLLRPVSLRCASPCARGNIRRHITTPLTLTLFLLYLGNHPFPCALACEMRQLASDAGRPVQLVYWLDAPTTRAERLLPKPRPVAWSLFMIIVMSHTPTGWPGPLVPVWRNHTPCVRSILLSMPSMFRESVSPTSPQVPRKALAPSYM